MVVLLKLEDLKHAFHQLTPDASQKERMKTVLQNNPSVAHPFRRVGVIVTACTAVLVLACGTIAFTTLSSGRRALPAIISSSSHSAISSTTSISTAATSSASPSMTGSTSSPSIVSTEVSASATKSAASTAVPTAATNHSAIVYHLMQYEDKQYQHLVRNDGVKTDYQGKPLYAQENEIGEQLGVVSFGWGKGSPVYRYKPAGDYRIVAVKIDARFELYTFKEFAGLDGTRLTYGPDACAYLDLYNIRSAADIRKIDVYQMDRYSHTGKGSGNDNGLDGIGSTEEAEMIERFYRLFAALRSDGNAYEIAVDNAPTLPYSTTVSPSTAIIQNSETPSTRVMPAQPPAYVLTAFENVQTLRLSLSNGQIMELTYYPNIRFLCQYTSRYALDDTLVDLIASLSP